MVTKKKMPAKVDAQAVGLFALGLYTEMDKLAKKAPRDRVTDLGLGRVNRAIRDARDVLPDNMYLVDLVEFVPAGENPELLDVVLILREILQQLRVADEVPPNVRNAIFRA